jgi:hypothetical protein
LLEGRDLLDGSVESVWEKQAARGGHIADVDKLTELSDEAAIAKAHALFSERRSN